MIKRAIKKIIQWAMSSPYSKLEGNEIAEPFPTPDIGIRNPGRGTMTSSIPDINLSVYLAVGGRVLEFHSYDNRTGDKKSHLYVIHDDEDFVENLSKILSVEVLKR